MIRKVLPKSRCDFIADLAHDVWNTYSSGKQLELHDIADDIDVGPTYDDFGGDFDGVIEYRSGDFHIFINTERNRAKSPRARFTLAHEYGHYFIDEHRNALAAGGPPHPSFTDRPAETPTELEANHFASHLLMPTMIFKAALANSPGGVEGICKLAKEFKVSAQSAAKRYVSESGRSCALIMFRDGDSPWWEVSTQFEEVGLHWMKRSQLSLPANCATAAATKDSPEKQTVHRQCDATASDWFKGIERGSKHDFTLKETAMRLGKWGVLTILES